MEARAKRLAGDESSGLEARGKTDREGRSGGGKNGGKGLVSGRVAGTVRRGIVRWGERKLGSEANFGSSRVCWDDDVFYFDSFLRGEKKRWARNST